MKIAKTVRNYFNYLNTCRELSLLTDRELADIGVRREAIHKIARHFN